MIIGLTGKNASGKGEAAEFLKKRGFTYFSLSDVLREELEKRRLVVSRENLTDLGNHLRKTHGASYLAERILDRLEDDRHYVVDSFRNPEEVNVFKKAGGFVLLGIEASPQKRFERLRLRNREKDPQTFDEFLTQETKEATNADPTKQNLDDTATMADHRVSNNGSLQALHETLTSLVSKILMHQPRPTWDEYFMKIARVVASRSNCMKRKVAAVIVKDGRIISTGYNGTPRGVVNCSEGGCPRCNAFDLSGQNLGDCFCSHAEENAIVQASYHGIAIKGATIFTTFSPCLLCTKMIINSGLLEVVYNEAYPLGEQAVGLLKQARIKVRNLSSHKLSR